MKAIDIKYPIMAGNTGYFEMNYETFDAEKTKLMNLMSTREGERIMHPQFGLGMEKYIFEQMTPQVTKQIESEITNKISFWIPNIQIDKMDVDVTTDVDKNQIDITLQFSLKVNPSENDIVTFRF